MTHLDELVYRCSFHGPESARQPIRPAHPIPEGLGRLACEEAVMLTVLFHDAVYSPAKGTNEEESCALFEQFADEAGLAEIQPEMVQQVAVSILCTKKHSVSPEDAIESPSKRFSSGAYESLSKPRQQDVLRFLDMDMAILASSRERYKEYAGQIRREYSHVSDVEFCSGRLHFLTSVVAAGKPTFLSPDYAELQSVAAANMEWEIASLEAIKRSTCVV